MDSSDKGVFLNEQITPKLLAVLHDADKYAVIVSPYLDLDRWEHAKAAIEGAVRRGIDLQFIVRNEPKIVQGQDVLWLLNQQIKVFSINNLHAKIYLNDRTTLVSSMNLTQFSAANSWEFALVVRDPQDIRLIRQFVKDDLLKRASPVRGPSLVDKVRGYVNKFANLGHCIRCGNAEDFDTQYPLCDDCYERWSQFGNPDYSEKFCHSCGQPSNVSYARPLCRSCYQQSTRS